MIESNTKKFLAMKKEKTLDDLIDRHLWKRHDAIADGHNECLEYIRSDLKQFIKEKLDELRMNNPYPSDIFTGKTEEGKIGRFGKEVWYRRKYLDGIEKALLGDKK